MRPLIGLTLVLVSLGCARQVPESTSSTKPASYPLEAAPPELQPAIAQADGAIGALQQRLGKKLMDELGRGGPPAAVRVCRDEAQTLSSAVATDKGLAVGRTSARLRNPRNAPPAWAQDFIAASEGKRAAEAQAVVVDLGARVGVLRPIPVGAVCLSCHGPSEALAPEVAAELRQGYPEDHATGFREGDLRGFFWAEAPKR